MRVAVIDVGSNSIKLLVAELGPDGQPVEVASRTLEVRISKGIGGDQPSLGAQGIARGASAVAELAGQAAGLGAEATAAVATSAVRDAANGAEFVGQVARASGVTLRILSGREEANLIGRGLATDPALASVRDFDVFDLGGGSLECLDFVDREVAAEVSLPLGCVRLTEKFVPHPSEPFAESSRLAIAAHVSEVVARSGFPIPVRPGCTVVGTGGTLTTLRAIAAARRGVALEAAPAIIREELIRDMLAEVGRLPLAQRASIAGLPFSRADVFPAALATLATLAELGHFREFRHSLRNLRWGVAADLLRRSD